MAADPFLTWFNALEERFVSTLTFQEIRRGVQALSSLYVERRGSIGKGSALDGAGKRAAYALYFAPLHFLLIREIVRALGASSYPAKTIVDLGCGTGVAAAAWALEMNPRPQVIGFERNAWVVQEARWTYSALSIRASIRAGDLNALRMPADAAVIAAFTLNEMDESARNHVGKHLLIAAEAGAPVLIVEPIAKRAMPWWSEWAKEWAGTGATEKEWRFHVPLPERLALLDKAAGLNHRELTGRSLWLPGRRA